MVVTFGLHFGSFWPSRFFQSRWGLVEPQRMCSVQVLPFGTRGCRSLQLFWAVHCGIFRPLELQISAGCLRLLKASIPFIIRYVFMLRGAWPARSYLDPSLHPRVRLSPFIVMYAADLERGGSQQSLVTAEQLGVCQRH